MKIFTQKPNSMKNLIFVTLLFIANLTFAQTNPATNLLPALDTLTNTTPVSLTKLVVGHYATVTVATVITKISGTVAGTAALQGSIDGVKYYAISGASNLTLTDVASQGTLWTLTDSPYTYYRVLGTGSGTMAASISAKIVLKK